MEDKLQITGLSFNVRRDSEGFCVCENKRKTKRPLEIQRPLVCAARRMTKALPAVISLYLSELHLFIAVVLVPFLLHLFLRWLSLPFSAALAQYFVLPRVPSFLCSSSSLVIFVPFMPPFLLPSSVTPPPLPILKPPPCVASSSSYLSPLPHYVHPIYLSVTVLLTPSTLASSVSPLPCLLPSVLRS